MSLMVVTLRASDHLQLFVIVKTPILINYNSDEFTLTTSAAEAGLEIG